MLLTERQGGVSHAGDSLGVAAGGRSTTSHESGAKC